MYASASQWHMLVKWQSSLELVRQLTFFAYLCYRCRAKFTPTADTVFRFECSKNKKNLYVQNIRENISKFVPTAGKHSHALIYLHMYICTQEYVRICTCAAQKKTAFVMGADYWHCCCWPRFYCAAAATTSTLDLVNLAPNTSQTFCFLTFFIKQSLDETPTRGRNKDELVGEQLKQQTYPHTHTCNTFNNSYNNKKFTWPLHAFCIRNICL